MGTQSQIRLGFIPGAGLDLLRLSFPLTLFRHLILIEYSSILPALNAHAEHFSGYMIKDINIGLSLIYDFLKRNIL